MSGNYEPKQARNTILKAKQCEGKFLADLGHKMATRVSLQFFRFKVT